MKYLFICRGIKTMTSASSLIYKKEVQMKSKISIKKRKNMRPEINKREKNQ